MLGYRKTVIIYTVSVTLYEFGFKIEFGVQVV